jgi:hypothetical protein
MHGLQDSHLQQHDNCVPTFATQAEADCCFVTCVRSADGMHIQSMTASEARTWSSHITDEVLNAIVWYWHRQALQAHLLDYSTADKTGTMIIEVR